MAPFPKPILSFKPAPESRGDQVATLIPLIANDDESAFNLFYKVTNGLLFGLLLRMLGNSQTAEDVLSELYGEVRKKASQFSIQNEKPLAWLILIAHRLVVERLCYAGQTRRVELSRKSNGKPDSTSLPDGFINITEQRRLVRAAIASLSDVQQEMVELAFFAGMTDLEIARNLGQPTEAVTTGLNSAVLQLFDIFKSMGFSSEPGTETNLDTVRYFDTPTETGAIPSLQEPLTRTDRQSLIVCPTDSKEL
jgi:RNA polymerase sigma-70 factor, ECF subfamily